MFFNRFGTLARTVIASAALLSAASSSLADTNPQVKFSTTQGDFVIELYPDKAPKTVANFLQYVKSNHYVGTIFHRVIPNFMVQAGGYDAKYWAKPVRPTIPHEGREAFDKGLRNNIGYVAMARRESPNSADAQFFVNVGDNSGLDPATIPPGDPVPRFEYQGQVFENTARAKLLNAPMLAGYTVFGKVVSGMNVIEKIRRTPTHAAGPFQSDVPKTPIVINSATLVN